MLSEQTAKVLNRAHSTVASELFIALASHKQAQGEPHREDGDAQSKDVRIIHDSHLAFEAYPLAY